MRCSSSGVGRAACLADDFGTQRAVRQQMCNVQAGAIGFEFVVEIFNINGAPTAVARDDGRATLREVTGSWPQVIDKNRWDFGLFACRGIFNRAKEVAVVVQIDEAGSNDQTRAINRSLYATDFELTDGNNTIPTNGQITDDAFASRAINDRSLREQHVSIDSGHCLLRAQVPRACQE